MKSQSTGNNTNDESKIAQAVANGVTPLISRIEQNNTGIQTSLAPVSRDLQTLIASIDALRKSTEDNSSAVLKSQSTGNNTNSVQDLSSVLSPLLTVLQTISSSVGSLYNTVQGNPVAVNEIISAISSVENAVKSQEADVISVNENSITQAVLSAFSPLVSRIEQNSSVYQTSSAVITRSIQELGGNIEALRKSADNSNSAMIQLQASVKSASDSYDATNITTAITPITGLLQNLLTTLTTIQSMRQGNETAILGVINSVQAIESILKSLDVGNNYDIDIIQQGFNVEKKSDADLLARSTANALRSGIGNGGI